MWWTSSRALSNFNPFLLSAWVSFAKCLNSSLKWWTNSVESVSGTSISSWPLSSSFHSFNKSFSYILYLCWTFSKCFHSSEPWVESSFLCLMFSRMWWTPSNSLSKINPFSLPAWVSFAKCLNSSYKWCFALALTTRRTIEVNFICSYNINRYVLNSR